MATSAGQKTVRDKVGNAHTALATFWAAAESYTRTTRANVKWLPAIPECRVTTSWLIRGIELQSVAVVIGCSVVVVGLDEENGVAQALNASPPATTKSAANLFTP